jgi:hypothetical protein
MDMNLTKGSSIWLHAIYSLFYWRILQKTILYSGFKTPKIRETEELESIHELHFVEKENVGKKTSQKLESEKAQVYAQKTSTKNAVQDFHLRKSFVNCPIRIRLDHVL